MMVRFPCPHCGKRWEVSPVYAGKTVRCNQCRGRMTIPVSKGKGDWEIVEEVVPEVLPEEPARGRGDERVARSARQKPSRPAFTDEPPPRQPEVVKVARRSPPPPDETSPGPESGGRPREKKRRKRRPGVDPGTVVLAGLGVLAVWLVLTGMGFYFRPVGLGMMLLGGLALSAGTRWILVLAAREGMGTYLCCLLVPFYDTWYTFTRFRKTWVPCLVCWGGRVFLVTATVLLFIHFFRGGLEEIRQHQGAGGAARAGAVEGDRECEELLAGPDATEARAWLEEPNKRRGFFKWGKKAALQFVKELYARGAERVTVAGIESDAGLGELGTHLVVTLPAEADRRQAVLGLINQRFEDEDDPRTDHGQKYELLTPD